MDPRPGQPIVIGRADRAIFIDSQAVAFQVAGLSKYLRIRPLMKRKRTAQVRPEAYGSKDSPRSKTSMPIPQIANRPFPQAASDAIEYARQRLAMSSTILKHGPRKPAS